MNRKLKLWELNRVSEEEFKGQEKFPITIILDEIRSLTNVGAFLERVMLLMWIKFICVESLRHRPTVKFKKRL